MANKDFFAQAIADARKLKEISLENAKQQIEEAFAPRIQEMFRLKLSELEEDPTEEEGMMEGTEEGMEEYAELQPTHLPGHGEEEETKVMDEMTLDEILAELELEEGSEEEGTEESLEEGHINADGYTGKAGKGGTGYDEKAKTTHGDKKLHEKKESEEEESTEEEGAEEGAEEMEVAELSVEEFKDLVRDVVADVLGAHEAAEGGEGAEEGGEESLEGGEEEISLDEILAELSEEDPKLGYAHGKQFPEMEEAKKSMKKAEEEGKMEEAKEKEEEGKMEEAIETINALKAQLNEVNLLNAKLLYVNKLFKASTLTETQKVRVVAAFDKAHTLNEAKTVYETLKGSLTSTKKTQIKESLGFASKPIGSAPARPIVEADSYVYRMQQLAGIKQPNI